MNCHGGRAVFMARFLPVVRTLAPDLAGATRLPYPRIASYSLVAARTWATAETGVGYAAATSLRHVLTLGGPALALVALSAIGGALLWRRRRRSSTGDPGSSPAGRDRPGDTGRAGIGPDHSGSLHGSRSR
jgi:membrane protein DedA with SNARE-associated domain